MSPPASYFLANRIWWTGTLFVSPIAAALASQPLVGIGLAAVLGLLALLVFDTDRPWWPAEVRQLPDDPSRSRAESRTLTLWSFIGLLAGVAIAVVGPWGA